MDEAEKQKLKELFDKKATNEAEAVENAKDCLDACLTHFGEEAEFILFVKAPHKDVISLNRCANAGFTIKAALRMAEHAGLGTADRSSKHRASQAYSAAFATFSSGAPNERTTRG